MKGVLSGPAGRAIAVSASLCVSLAVVPTAADDNGFEELNDGHALLYETGGEYMLQRNLRLVANRIVNGRANLVMVGDSIIDAGMSAGYIATFRPRHGYRGYAVSGGVPNTGCWHSYTNVRTSWTTEAKEELDGTLAHLKGIGFTFPDNPDEETGNPGSAWEAYAAPCNVARLACLADLPDDFEVFGFGSAWFYERIYADGTFLTEPGTRLRSRIFWFDHPTAMDFDVQLQSTVSEEEGGFSEVISVPVSRTEELTAQWMELPGVIELGEGPRNMTRRTQLVITTPEGRIEEAGEAMLLGGSRVWNEAREKGIQWGFAATGGAQAREHTWVPVDVWRKYIEFQQADTYLLQLGVNDLFHGVGNSGVTAAQYINQLIEQIYDAHRQAQANDPEIQDPLFLLVSMWDSHNPQSGPYLDNTQWRLLAEGQAEIAKSRTDTAFVDLRAVVEEEYGQWFFWRNQHLTDRIHPKGPYWVPGTCGWQEDPNPDGAVYFAQIVWDALEGAADTEEAEGMSGPPACACDEAIDGGCLCRADLTCDGLVDGADMAVILSAWGTDPPYPAEADLTDDGYVGGADIAVLLAAWGACP